MYKRAFPVERGTQDVQSIISLRDSFKKTPKSNFDDFLTSCIDNCPKF